MSSSIVPRRLTYVVLAALVSSPLLVGLTACGSSEAQLTEMQRAWGRLDNYDQQAICRGWNSGLTREPKLLSMLHAEDVDDGQVIGDFFSNTCEKDSNGDSNPDSQLSNEEQMGLLWEFWQKFGYDQQETMCGKWNTGGEKKLIDLFVKWLSYSFDADTVESFLSAQCS